MKKKIYQYQNGAISVFAMVAMLFFVLTTLGIYTLSSKRAQTQTESIDLIQERYNIDENGAYNSKIAESNAVIPIYTKDQLFEIGSDENIEIDGIIYKFSLARTYELKNDIIINISELDDNVFNETGKNLTKHGYEIYYYNNGNYYIPTDGTADYTDSHGNKFILKN